MKWFITLFKKGKAREKQVLPIDAESLHEAVQLAFEGSGWDKREVDRVESECLDGVHRV